MRLQILLTLALPHEGTEVILLPQNKRNENKIYQQRRLLLLIFFSAGYCKESLQRQQKAC